MTEPRHIASSQGRIRHMFIRNLELLGRIGIYGHEKIKLQPIRVNVDLGVEDAPGVQDRLEDVVDYAEIDGKVRAIVNAGHINLAETLAERIAQACLADPRIKSARIRVEKLHALPGAESGGVEIERQRP